MVNLTFVFSVFEFGMPLMTHLNLRVVPVLKTSAKNCLSRTTDWFIDTLLCSSLFLVCFFFSVFALGVALLHKPTTNTDGVFKHQVTSNNTK